MEHEWHSFQLYICCGDYIGYICQCDAIVRAVWQTNIDAAHVPGDDVPLPAWWCPYHGRSHVFIRQQSYCCLVSVPCPTSMLTIPLTNSGSTQRAKRPCHRYLNRYYRICALCNILYSFFSTTANRKLWKGGGDSAANKYCSSWRIAFRGLWTSL